MKNLKTADKIRVSVVSYINSYPFIYGIKNSDMMDKIELTDDPPALCAQKLINDEADLGLVPVAILPLLPHYEIIGNYCIGATGPVKTVLLLSQDNPQNLKTIYLDNESRTSVQLIRVIVNEFWKKDVIWKNLAEYSGNYDEPNTGFVMIGDKTFVNAPKFSFVTDLAEEWQKQTSLPFVFACWVANKKLPDTFISEFNQAVEFGINNREKSIVLAKNPIISKEAMIDYLENSISYDFDEKKHEALNLFLGFLKAKRL
jgi:chorismate dehydratase